MAIPTVPDRPRRNPDSSFRKMGDEGGLVVLPGRAEVKVLNPVGILVYRLIDGEHTLDEIIQAVWDEFDVSTEEAREGVMQFLGELARHGMLEPGAGDTAGVAR